MYSTVGQNHVTMYFRPRRFLSTLAHVLLFSRKRVCNRLYILQAKIALVCARQPAMYDSLARQRSPSPANSGRLQCALNGTVPADSLLNYCPVLRTGTDLA